MNIIKKIFRKLFLVMEIKSKEGVLHFRRYRVISTPFFNIFVHQILQSDQDKHFHTHPWNFKSLILKGSYSEDVKYPPSFMAIHNHRYFPGDIARHNRHDAHKLQLQSPCVWSLVLTFGREYDWRYHTKNGWIQHNEYHRLKNKGKLPQ